MPQPQTQLQPQVKHVKIQKGNPSNVDNDPVEVSKKNRDQVEWSGPGDWLVVFDGPSPFERDHFDPAHPGNTDIVVAGDDHQYKYTVYVDGKKGADPIIIVRP
ncbi:MAG TPA: hypothetical protein VFQ24_10030 [Terriglobia bacterium]|nr:hypothetical protein [Terriglobia bacterium]